MNLQRLSVHFWYLHLFTQKPDVMHYYVCIKHCCVNVELNRSIFVTSQWRICREYQYIFDTLHLFTQKPDVIHYYVRIKHCCVNVELNRSIFITSQWRICRDYQYIFDTLHLFSQKPEIMHYYVCIKHCCVNVELNVYIRHISMMNLQRLSVHFWHLTSIYSETRRNTLVCMY